MEMQLGATLHVYKGEWGLPSIDFECLRALVSSVASHKSAARRFPIIAISEYIRYSDPQCLLRFTRCPMEVQTSSNPLRSGAGKLPYLQIGNDKFAGYRQIKRVLDREVSAESRARKNKKCENNAG